MIPIKQLIKKSQADTIHVLGNGPSLELFNRNEWSDDHEFVGCNFSNPDLRPDYTVMMDVKPIMQFYQGYKLSIPLVISERCESYIAKDKKGWERLPADSFVLFDVIPMIHEKPNKYPMNSGHHATLYGINRNKETVKTVHLWGFDSFWSNDISSRTDELVKRTGGPRVNLSVSAEWRKYWSEIFDKHKNIKFVIEGNNEKLS
jgi:hypothetical protein